MAGAEVGLRTHSHVHYWKMEHVPSSLDLSSFVHEMEASQQDDKCFSCTHWAAMGGAAATVLFKEVWLARDLPDPTASAAFSLPTRSWRDQKDQWDGSVGKGLRAWVYSLGSTWRKGRPLHVSRWPPHMHWHACVCMHAGIHKHGSVFHLRTIWGRLRRQFA